MKLHNSDMIFEPSRWHHRSDTLADKINRDPSDAKVIVYFNDDDMNMIMSLSYYAGYLLGKEAQLQ